MKRSFVFLFHIGFWICYSLLVLVVLAVYSRNFQSESEAISKISNALKNLSLFAILPSIVSYVAYSFILFPKYFSQKKYFTAVGLGLLLSLATSIIFYLTHRSLIENGYIADMDRGGSAGRSTAIIVITATTIIGAICGVVAFIIKGFITWFEEVKIKEELKEKNFEIEMALIRSQLDPHLLFNTINNIDALILKDANTASIYLNKLSEIMRFILYETKTEKIPLSRELEYIGKYIDLQKIRTANDQYVDYKVMGNVDSREIAPMVFIPFIENAFKHASNKKVENAIKVIVIIEDDTTRLVCENKFETKTGSKERDGGLGNELIQKRLELIYPHKHKLEVFKIDDTYIVNLTVNNG